MTAFSFGLINLEHKNLRFATECKLSDKETMFICEFNVNSPKHHFEEFARSLNFGSRNHCYYVLSIREGQPLKSKLEEYKKNIPALYYDTTKRCIKVEHSKETGYSASFVDYSTIDPKTTFHYFVE